jgi:hypothetical protein
VTASLKVKHGVQRVVAWEAYGDEGAGADDLDRLDEKGERKITGTIAESG